MSFRSHIFTVVFNWIAPITIFGIMGCDQTNYGINPAFPGGGLLASASPVKQDVFDALEGKFDPTLSLIIENTVVTKSTTQGLSLFFGSDDSYAALRGGCSPTAGFVLEGYWRRRMGKERGLMRLFVEPQTVGESWCRGEPAEPVGAGFAFVGAISEDDDVPHRPVRLEWKAPLRPYRNVFTVIAHRGGCFPHYDCGASGNSLETIRFAYALGADAVEIDIQFTRDGVPIVYHDPGFGAYQSAGRFCTGSVSSNTLAEIRANCRLVKGEPIPTLEEALDTLVLETQLTGVYLDTKNADAVPKEVELALAANAKAAALGRRFVAAIGIPNERVKDAFVASAPPGTPCLLEYDPEVALALGCTAWAPTFTAGPRADDVKRIQDAGLKVFFWTINVEEIVDEFLRVAKPDGILTNRPGLVFYRYQLLETNP